MTSFLPFSGICSSAGSPMIPLSPVVTCISGISCINRIFGGFISRRPVIRVDKHGIS